MTFDDLFKIQDAMANDKRMNNPEVLFLQAKCPECLSQRFCLIGGDYECNGCHAVYSNNEICHLSRLHPFHNN